jgi:adenylylsulfate kinase-like enzyme
MWLREGDSEKKLPGKVIWIIGRRDSGKTTLADAIQKAVPDGIVLVDDFLRCRTVIRGKDRLAYNQMIGLSWSLAYQGYDSIVCAGARTKELRNYIRSEIPSVIFVYIHGRGQYCADYQEPGPDEKDVIRLDSLDVKNELMIVLRKIWKITIG